MAVQDHFIIELSNLSTREKRSWYYTVGEARTAAAALAAENPGKTLLVYRLVKVAVAPPSAVVESDPVVG